MCGEPVDDEGDVLTIPDARVHNVPGVPARALSPVFAWYAVGGIVTLEGALALC